MEEKQDQLSEKKMKKEEVSNQKTLKNRIEEELIDKLFFKGCYGGLKNDGDLTQVIESLPREFKYLISYGVVYIWIGGITELILFMINPLSAVNFSFIPILCIVMGLCYLHKGVTGKRLYKKFQDKI